MSNLPNFSAYQVIRELGHNLQGGRVVYLARQISNDILVVIKQFQFAKSQTWSGFKQTERERDILKELKHKGIPSYLDAFETDDGFCLVQEYKEAQPLSTPRSFEPDQVKDIAVQLLEILVYLQSRIPSVIHRDIKPENILVDEALNVYLIDFGFARIGGEVAMSSMAAGTFGFMAPEQIYNKGLTEATDLYGLGATLICLLTNTKSRNMDSLSNEDGRISFKHLSPKLSLRFIKWLEKMTAPKLTERYPNAETALETLKTLYLIRCPSVEIDKSSLEFEATSLGEKLTQTITISNPTPETILEGEWEVAPHDNDPPHTPQSHAWISFSPKQFKGNQVKCRVTVDTSKLIAQTTGKRFIVLHTNSTPETYTVPIKIATAPLVLDFKRPPYLVVGVCLIYSFVWGFIFFNPYIWFLAVLPIASFYVALWRTKDSVRLVELLSSIRYLGSLPILFTGFWNSSAPYLGLVWLCYWTMVIISIELFNRYLMSKDDRDGWLFYLIFASTLLCGSLGGFAAVYSIIRQSVDLYLTFGALGVGLSLAFLLFSSALIRRNKIAAYRKQEQHLLKP